MYFRDYSLHISLTDWLVCVVQHASVFCYATGECHKALLDTHTFLWENVFVAKLGGGNNNTCG